jgi:hypothetical protein
MVINDYQWRQYGIENINANGISKKQDKVETREY